MFEKLRNLFIALKIKRDPRSVEIHPELKLSIKYEFTAGGKDYYSFLNDHEIPILRFRFVQKFYAEMMNRVTHTELKAICEQGKKLLNEGKLGETWRLLDDLNYQLDWAFEPESLLRFASALYFDLRENVIDYDIKYNAPKIQAFKKKGVFTTLVTKLMNGSKILADLSTKDLDTYLKEMVEEKERMSFTEGGAKGKRNMNMRTTSISSMPKEIKEKS